MLQSQTVEPGTLGLLKELMALDELKQFVLVGGTNLSLRFGHRLSIDLDLFTNQPFDSEYIRDRLTELYSEIIVTGQGEKSLFLFINRIKIDIVCALFDNIQPVDEIEGIRLASIPDIIAMKLNAIARRGVKKDFWDVVELLNHYSLSQMVEFFKAKYPKHDIFHVVRSLVYFEDAEAQKDPDPLKEVTWEQVKIRMREEVNSYIASMT